MRSPESSRKKRTLQRAERAALKGRKTTVRIGRATKKPDRILADDAYWNVPFLDRFLNRCDQVAMDEPRKAYEMATPTVVLADARITIQERPGAYLSETERRSYRVHARAVLASCARRIGELDQAEKLYRAAFQIARRPIHADAQASLRSRYGWLLFHQGKPEALQEADTAIELAVDKVTLAAALLLRGAAAFKFEPRRTGLQHLAQSLTLAKAERASQRGYRVFYSALHAIAKILSDCNPTFAAQANAYSLLEQVRAYLAGRPKSIAKMQVYWQMGRIAFNLGHHRHGPRLLRRARKGLFDLGEKLEYALITLDLAGFHLHNQEFAEYDQLVSETVTVLEAWGNPKLLKAVSSWSRQVRVSPATLFEIRQALQKLTTGESPPS